jgi:hypothetical protein
VTGMLPTTLDLLWFSSVDRAPWRYSAFVAAIHRFPEPAIAISLIRAKLSLIARFNSLQGRKKFPAPMRRELIGKPRVSRHFLLPLAPTAEHKSMKFPVFSLLAGNFGASETGSLVTAPSSAESCANLTSGAGLVLVKEMVKKADVFTENFASGAVERLGARAGRPHRRACPQSAAGYQP